MSLARSRRSLSSRSLSRLPLPVLLVLAAYWAYQAYSSEALPALDGRIPELRDGPVYAVTRVVDGDTIEIMMSGRTETVRLIGVNTPETKHPTKDVEHFGKEASAFTRQQLEGRSVRLEFDVERRDRYGRLLAYVYLESGPMFNAVLVAEGYAQLMTVPPNVKHQDLFLALEREAREAEKGLWAR